jgi:hypothetical protein
MSLSAAAAARAVLLAESVLAAAEGEELLPAGERAEGMYELREMEADKSEPPV